jgi:hypothetical protein
MRMASISRECQHDSTASWRAAGRRLPNATRLRVMIASAAVCAGMAVSTASPQTGVSRPLAERVTELTRASRWTLVQ